MSYELHTENQEYKEHLERQRTFEDAFDEAGLPDGLRGEMQEFEKGNLTVKIGFNADYDSFYPYVSFWAFGNQIHKFGWKHSERMHYKSTNVVEKVTGDEVQEAVKHAKNLVEKIEKFTQTVSLDTFDKEQISFRLHMIFMTHKFGTVG